jgi:hypothetical protein
VAHRHAGFLLGVIGDCGRPAVQAAVSDLVPFGIAAGPPGLQFWAVNLGFSAAPSRRARWPRPATGCCSPSTR